MNRLLTKERLWKAVSYEWKEDLDLSVLPPEWSNLASELKAAVEGARKATFEAVWHLVETVVKVVEASNARAPQDEAFVIEALRSMFKTIADGGNEIMDTIFSESMALYRGDCFHCAHPMCPAAHDVREFAPSVLEKERARPPPEISSATIMKLMGRRTEDLIGLCSIISKGDLSGFQDLVMMTASTFLMKGVDRNKVSPISTLGSGFKPELNPREIPDVVLDKMIDIIMTVMRNLKGIEIDEKKLKERMRRGDHVIDLVELRKGNFRTLEQLLGVNSMEEVKKLLEKEPKREEKP